MKPNPDALINEYREAIKELLNNCNPKTFEERNQLYKEAWSILYNACEHKTKVIVKSLLSNGRPIYQEQCVLCGNTGSGLKHTPSVIKAAIDKVDFTEANKIIQDMHKEANKKIDEIFEINRRQGYDDYMTSPAWRSRTQMVLERDQWQCQARLSGCQKRASDVHHITYTYFGNEPLFTLTSVCRNCHDKMTKMEGRHQK